jgi:hypothetical protein
VRRPQQKIVGERNAAAKVVKKTIESEEKLHFPP